MFYRDYNQIFDGQDGPLPRSQAALRSAPQRCRNAPQDNSPGRVLFEIGLFIAIPLVLAVVVTLLLNISGVSAGA